MKRLIIYNLSIFVVISSFFSACSGTKEARSIKNTINGDWLLQTITIEGNNSILNAKVFNEADNNCFIGSSWNFISNNGKGSYSLPSAKGGCVGLTRKIRWTIYEPAGEEKKFQFKRIDDKNNPLDDNNGYRLTVGLLTDNSMQLQSTISYNGLPVRIIYNFVKKQIK